MYWEGTDRSSYRLLLKKNLGMNLRKETYRYKKDKHILCFRSLAGSDGMRGKMNVVAYCRVSTDKSDQLNSLETQRQFFLSYCERNHLKLIHTYADEGISGTKTKNRKEFLQMMQDAKNGLFEEVIVKDVSRLARNTVDFLQSIRSLKQLHIETVFITSDMKTLGNSEFVLTLMGAMAQEESANTSKRVKFGKKENAKKGRVPNLVYGYDKVSGDYFHLNRNDAEVKVVQQIFLWYTEEGYGAGRIASMLNARCIRTKRGALWTQNAVRRILINELYIGKVINGKQEVSDFLTGMRRNTEPEQWLVNEQEELRIIEPDQFYRAAQIMKERRKRMQTENIRESNKYLFSTLIHCGECGYSYRRMERTYRNTYVYWVCSGRNQRGTDSCANKVRLREEEIIREITDYIAGFLPPKEKLTKRIADVISKTTSIDGCEEEAKRLQQEIRLLHQKKDKVKQMYLDDIISRDELRQRMETYENEISNANKKLQLVSIETLCEATVITRLSQNNHNPKDFLRSSSWNNACLKKLLDRIEVDKGQVTVCFKRILS